MGGFVGLRTPPVLARTRLRNLYFHIGSAGSTILVLQTLLPALMMQNEISHISIHGGTHNPMAPTADFIESCFLPALHKLGIKVDFECERAGFFPIGAGQINITTYPWIDKLEYSVLDKGKLLEIHGYAAAVQPIYTCNFAFLTYMFLYAYYGWLTACKQLRHFR